jgi:hypothetical protein
VRQKLERIESRPNAGGAQIPDALSRPEPDSAVPDRAILEAEDISRRPGDQALDLHAGAAASASRRAMRFAIAQPTIDRRTGQPAHVPTMFWLIEQVDVTSDHKLRLNWHLANPPANSPCAAVAALERGALIASHSID